MIARNPTARIPDPVLRQSTRLTCAAVFSAQTTLDPLVIRGWFGDAALMYGFFKGASPGVPRSEALSDAAEALYVKASPVMWLTSDDTPVWASYSQPAEPAEDLRGVVHHPRFGKYLKDKMDSLGVRCVVRLPGDVPSVPDDCCSFLMKNFGMK
jgi:acetyl esterase